MPQKKVVSKSISSAKKAVVANSDNNIVEFAIARAHVMKNLLETLRYILDEANLVFTKDNIKITTCNEKETIFIFVKLRTCDADHYSYEANMEQFCVGVDVSKLHKVMKTINANDLLSLRVVKDNPRALSIETYSSCDRSFKTVVTLPPFDVTAPRIQLPRLTYKTKLAINASRLQKAVRDLENFGVVFVQIQCIGNQLMIKSFQGGIVKQCTTFEGMKIADNATDDENFGVSESSTSELYSGVFHLKSLTYCTRSTALNDTINIYLLNNTPLLLEYPVGSFGYLRCLLFEVLEDSSISYDQ